MKKPDATRACSFNASEAPRVENGKETSANSPLHDRKGQPANGGYSLSPTNMIEGTTIPRPR